MGAGQVRVHYILLQNYVTSFRKLRLPRNLTMNQSVDDFSVTTDLLVWFSKLCHGDSRF